MVSADPATGEIIAVPLLVMLIVSLVSGTVIVPFPSKSMILCVWFIGVTPVVATRSCQIGCGDNSIPDDGVVIVVVVLLSVVEAATGVVVILDAKIIANVKIVVAVTTGMLRSKSIFLLLLLLLLFWRLVTSLLKQNK
jgi:hypothetical protein